MKKLLLLCIVILATSCDYFSNGVAEKAKFPKFKKNTIEFKNNTILLTSGYTKTTSEDFKRRVNELNDASKFKKIALQELEKIEDKKVDFEIFAHEDNVENYIFVYATDFYKLDEHRAARVVATMNNQRKDESNVQDVKYKRIHGRYFFTPTSKVVKLKYLKAFKTQKKFQTEYIVASKYGGIGLSISNLEDVDFENSIKRLAVK
ncbi:hypothetical protein U6A24_17125 [Aquimarina gracilis]|uniref:Lipoprotein n=1 Tax=Aquimarina gracilis TaxID=874422 RepID=A0ABU5ZZ57_9FLAO|nr:hypothetical protein [Aquimarina gracilis]MEB3347200.1 hypothetical protein [Aquimarina gracilis]